MQLNLNGEKMMKNNIRYVTIFEKNGFFSLI